MNLFATTAILCGIFSLITSAIAIYFGRLKLHRLLLNFNIWVGIWGFGCFLVGIATTSDKAIVGWNIASAGGIFIGPAFYHMVCHFCARERRKVVNLSYAIAWLYGIGVFSTNYFIHTTRITFGLHYPVINYFYGSAVVFYLTFVCLSYYELVTFLKKTKGAKRLQTLYIIFGFLAGFVGATSALLPIFGLDIFYPAGNIGIVIYNIILTFAIFRYRLMEINILFKRALVYTLSVGLITGLFLLVVLSLTKLLTATVGVSSYATMAIAAISIAILFEPLKNKTQFFLDKLFNRTTYDYYAAIQNLSRGLSITTDLKSTYKYIIDSVFSLLNLKSAVLLSCNNDYFKPVFLRFSSNSNELANSEQSQNIQLSKESKLIEYLEDYKGSILIKEELDGKIPPEHVEVIRDELMPLLGEVVAPVFIDHKLSAILILGEKVSENVYEDEDIDLLKTVANQSAIAIRNARLYNELEERVKGRTLELTEANEHLTAEVTERKRAEDDLIKTTNELHRINQELKATQSQMLQREKMASVGQLAAGVAHEINNPTSFVASNLETLGTYFDETKEVITCQNEIIKALQGSDESGALEKINALREKTKIDYILGDGKDLIEESIEGTDRITNIVKGLRTFARTDQNDSDHENINSCLESTLNIVWNELKYKSTVEKSYGELPLIECYPQQLNQVFMNILVNAAQAIETEGKIAIKTKHDGDSIYISISDNGCGIPADIQSKIFDPFFTTKEVGKGTGLGMSISYEIIKKHNGEIKVESEEGKGTTFVIQLPVGKDVIYN